MFMECFYSRRLTFAVVFAGILGIAPLATGANWPTFKSPVKFPPVKVPTINDIKREVSNAPGNVSNTVKQGAQQVSNFAAQLDPSKALREEFERAKKAALAGLKKLDLNYVNNQVGAALGKKIAGLGTPDPRTGSVDLRATDMGRGISHNISNFAQGNNRSSSLDEFSYNIQSRELVLKCHVRHRHNWGKVIPGVGTPDLYDVTQKASLRYKFGSSSVEFDLDFGPLAPRASSRAANNISDGNIIGALQAAVPHQIGALVRHEEKNNYDQKHNAYVARYGADNVYFASKQFVNWATPETAARHVANGIITAGASVYPQIMADLRQQAENELPQIINWLQQKGANDAERVARELITGQKPRWPFIKFEIIPVQYASRNKPLNAIETPWIKVDHLAFVIVWQGGAANNANTANPPIKQIPVNVHNDTNQLQMGGIRLVNNYAGYVDIKIYHPADISRPFMTVRLQQGETRDLYSNNQRVIAGSDWRTQIVFGNGVQSHPKAFSQVSGYHGGTFSINASDIYTK